MIKNLFFAGVILIGTVVAGICSVIHQHHIAGVGGVDSGLNVRIMKGYQDCLSLNTGHQNDKTQNCQKIFQFTQTLFICSHV